VLALQSARALLVPIILAVLVSYVLEPPVALLVRRGVARAAAATLISIVCDHVEALHPMAVLLSGGRRTSRNGAA
jgi:hypothetical protein